MGGTPNDPKVEVWVGTMSTVKFLGCQHCQHSRAPEVPEKAPLQPRAQAAACVSTWLGEEPSNPLFATDPFPLRPHVSAFNMTNPLPPSGADVLYCLWMAPITYN